MKFLLLFLAIPLLEVVVFMKVGGAIGASWTILLTIGTAILGAVLVRTQGIRTLFSVKDQLAQGQLPAATMAEGIILLVCGAFLLVPGFISDTIGFLGLIPSIRQSVAKGIVQRVFIARAGAQGFNNQNDIPGEFTRDSNNKVIEGQFKREE
ncbi:MAG: UPF0716 protein FxsA [Psychrobacter glaciei]|jgi:UPF0716 protein FxsA